MAEVEAVAVTSLFASPIGIALDHRNDVYVADEYGNRIEELSPRGRTSVPLERKGAGPGNSWILQVSLLMQREISMSPIPATPASRSCRHRGGRSRSGGVMAPKMMASFTRRRASPWIEPRMSMWPILTLFKQVGFGNRDPEIASTIAGRLARLDKRLTKDDRAALSNWLAGLDSAKLLIRLWRRSIQMSRSRPPWRQVSAQRMMRELHRWLLL